MGNGSLYFDIELPSGEHLRAERITRYFMRTMKRGAVLCYDKKGNPKQIGVWGTC